jgi:hypothetical protein
MFKRGDKVHVYNNEVGTVNGFYEGPFFGDLHSFVALSGEKCAAELSKGGSVFGLKEGHDPKGKSYWDKANRNAPTIEGI